MNKIAIVLVIVFGLLTSCSKEPLNNPVNSSYSAKFEYSDPASHVIGGCTDYYDMSLLVEGVSQEKVVQVVIYYDCTPPYPGARTTRERFVKNVFIHNGENIIYDLLVGYQITAVEIDGKDIPFVQDNNSNNNSQDCDNGPISGGMLRFVSESSPNTYTLMLSGSNTGSPEKSTLVVEHYFNGQNNVLKYTYDISNMSKQISKQIVSSGQFIGQNIKAIYITKGSDRYDIAWEK